MDIDNYMMEDTELDSMLKNNKEVKVKESSKWKFYIKTQQGLWLSLKMFMISLLIFITILIVVLLILYFIFLSNIRKTVPNNSMIDNQTAWNECLQLSTTLNKCFDSPLCPKEKNSLNTRNISYVVKDVRLPLSVIPSLYTLILQPHIHLSDPNLFFFNGSSEIIAHVQNSTSILRIHTYKLMVNESLIRILDAADQVINIKNISYDNERQWFNIEMTQDIPTKSDIKIIFGQFRGSLKPSLELKGWYLSTYIEKGVSKYLATSQLQPTDARMVFPCFDEPGFKAKFKVIIHRKKDYHALTNMERINEKEIGDDWVLDEFKTTFTMSTYLLAFVVSQLANISGVDSKGRVFTVWSRPDVIHNANYSLTIGIKILEFFEDYFEHEYPLNKTDMVAVPDFTAGAMENWGLIIYREITMLWDSTFGSADSRQKVATVVSHEIAHQWFGNLVTLKWWDDLWLNEGFASFVEYVGVAHVHSDWLMDEQFALHELQKVLIPDSLVTSHPVLIPVNHPNEINEIFDTISYNKGASVLRMMEAYLGQETFRRGLKRYLGKYKYKNTIHNDLWGSLTEQAKIDGKNIPVKEIMDTWIKQMGYPLVSVTRTGETTLFVKQQHFIVNSAPDEVSLSSLYNFTWVIPLTYATESSPTWDMTERVIWMWNKSSYLTLPSLKANDWVLFNLHQAGFYRIQYDEENWKRLINQLRNNHKQIPVKNRAQLIDDLFNLGKVGMVNFSLVLNLTEYLRLETDYIPWEAANRMFAFIGSMFDTDDYYGLLQSYFSYLVDPIYKTVNWDSMIENENHIKNLMRPIAVTIACEAKHEGCIKMALERFYEFIKTNDSGRIPSSLKHIVYCMGIKYTSLKEWDFLYEKLTDQDNEEEIARIIKALTCSQEPWILKRFIKKLVNKDNMKISQIVEMMGGLSNNPTGKYVFSDFLWTNYKNISKSEGSPILDNEWPISEISSLSKLLSGNLLLFARVYAKKCHKPAECMSIEELIKIRNFAMDSGIVVNDKLFAQAIEQVRQNQNFLSLHRETIGKWLETIVPSKVL